MKCPNCGKTIKATRHSCKYCGTKLVRKSDKMASKMTMNAGVSLVAGGLLAFLGLIMLLYGMYVMGGISFGLGVLLVLVGKKMS